MNGSSAIAHAGLRSGSGTVPRDWPGAARSRFVEAGGLRWHVQEHGSGPTIVLVHGAGASLHSFAPLVRRLARDHHCIAFDLPGHGFTSPFTGGAYTLAHTADALDALLTALGADVSRFVGHSAGAAIALQWLLARRDDRLPPLVAINPALRPFGGLAGVAFPALARAAAASRSLASFIAHRAARPAQVQRLIAGTGSAVPAEMLDCYQFLFSRPAHVRAVLTMMAGWQLDGMMRSLTRLDPQLHVVLGGRDRAVAPRQTAAMLAGLERTTVTWLERYGHLVHEEAPDAVAALVKRESTGDATR